MSNDSSFEWDVQLETGYSKIDNQHKQLFAAVRSLMDASASGKGDKAVMETLEFLVGYAVKHFNDEEQLQKDYEYPDLLLHTKIHNDFKAAVTELVQKVTREGPTPIVIDEVCTVVKAWLLNHIKGDDFRMATYVKAADVKAMGSIQ